MSEHDPVNSPSHYTSGKIEVIDFITDQKLGFELGNVVKYVARAGKKDSSPEIEDLKKARWYLNHRIGELTGDDETEIEAIKRRARQAFIDGQIRAGNEEADKMAASRSFECDIAQAACVGSHHEAPTDRPRSSSDSTSPSACPPPLRGASSY